MYAVRILAVQLTRYTKSQKVTKIQNEVLNLIIRCLNEPALLHEYGIICSQASWLFSRK